MDRWLIAIIAIVATLITWGIITWCKSAGRASRQEEQENPCAGCLRWDECNGVDTECPWRC